MKPNKLFSLVALLLCALLLLSACTPAATDPEPDPSEPPAAPADPSPSAPAEPPAEPAQTGAFVPGTYLATGPGRGGPIVVEADFSADRIEAIRVLSHHETYTIGNVPVERYPAAIVEAQSLNVDIVTGATISSAALLTAIRQCVTDAGGDPATLNGPVTGDAQPAGDASADVVVIGGGAAGLTAATYAAKAGASVILVEKLSILGGTSTYSIESFGASESGVHKALRSAATSEDNYQSLVSGNPNGKPEAFRVLADNNGEAADWLRSIGAPLAVAGSGASVAPSREAGKMGVTISSALIGEAKKSGVDLRTDTKAVGLTVDDGAITGVNVENKAGAYTITAQSVVIASGGFGANNEMVAQNKPIMQGYAFACSPGATGDGHVMAEAAGAALADMDYIRVNFTYHTRNGYVYYTGSLPNTGGIFVNNDGVRVANDQGGYGVGPSIVENHGGEGWLVFDHSLLGVQDVREYYELGLYETAATIEELADKIGVNRENLATTVETYKGYVAAGQDPEFNRALLTMTFDEAPYYACKFTCHVQGTFGGIVTNVDTQALAADGSVIPNLYAVGECASSGTYGANPMAVNIVFGRIAGERAAANAA